jgi:hypothetical protein
MRRTFSTVLLVGVAVMVVLALGACGSSGSVTTTGNRSPTTGGGAATTAGTGTTGATATDSTATTGAATLEEYKTKMMAWVTGPLTKLDTSVFDIADASNPTEAQIAAVDAFVAQAKAALDQLLAIQPSAEATAGHAQFVKAYKDLLAGTEQFASAMRSKDASQLPAIQETMTAAAAQIQEAQGILGPIIGITPPAS